MEDKNLFLLRTTQGIHPGNAYLIKSYIAGLGKQISARSGFDACWVRKYSHQTVDRTGNPGTELLFGQQKQHQNQFCCWHAWTQQRIYTFGNGDQTLHLFFSA